MKRHKFLYDKMVSLFFLQREILRNKSNKSVKIYTLKFNTKKTKRSLFTILKLSKNEHNSNKNKYKYKISLLITGYFLKINFVKLILIYFYCN